MYPLLALLLALMMSALFVCVHGGVWYSFITPLLVLVLVLVLVLYLVLVLHPSFPPELPRFRTARGMQLQR